MDFFEGAILSSWSDIMGPQVERLWLRCTNTGSRLTEIPTHLLKDFNLSKACSGTPLFSEDVQASLKKFLMMSGQLLLSEVETSKPFQENASRFFLSDDKILTSVVFHFNSWRDSNNDKEARNVCLCLGILLKCEVLTFILDSIQLIDHHIRRAICVLQKTKGPVDMSMKEISSILGNLETLLSSLYSDNLSQLPPEVKFQNSLNSKLMSKAVVSHLQTSGHSVVIGGSQFVVNQVLQILSLFNTEKERSCSRGICDSEKSFHHGLYLQATLKSEKKQSESLLDEAVPRYFPITVIDTDWSKVWQSFSVEDNGEKNRNSLQIVTETGSLVPQLLDDLVFFKSNQDNFTLIQQFHRFLMLKCVSLIKTVEHFRQLGKLLTRKELLTMLGLTEVADIQIILGCAEKLKPGIRTAVL